MLEILGRKGTIGFICFLFAINLSAQDSSSCKCLYRDSVYYNCSGNRCNQTDSIFQSQTIFVYSYVDGHIAELTILYRPSNKTKEKIIFNPNGKIADSITYEYREDGSVNGIHHYKNGYMYEYTLFYPNGKNKALERYDQLGRKTDFLITWYESGAIEKVYFHYDGKMKLKMELDRKGNVTSLMFMENSFTPLLLFDLKKGRIKGLESILTKEILRF